MIRWLAVCALAAGACKNQLPARPDPAAFAKLSPAAKCVATAVRGELCADELMIASLHELGSDMGDGSAMRELEDKVRDTPRANAEQAHQMHRINCAGSTGYADAVFACWQIDDCDAFATCVSKQHAR